MFGQLRQWKQMSDAPPAYFGYYCWDNPWTCALPSEAIEPDAASYVLAVDGATAYYE